MALVPAETEKYDVLEVIGRGAFGIIRKVRRKNDGYILCRKEINYLKMSQKERDQLTAEFSILASLKHPNIVGYFHREHLKQTQELYMYMEYCGGGDLGSIIKDLKARDQYAQEDFVWRIFAQLITALYRCHYGVDPPEPGNDFRRIKDNRPPITGKATQMILHRDLKPENIFLGDDHAVKLGDFGLSKLMQSHDFASTYVGTPFYMSPEICAAEKYTLQSDIWSVGCIMHELCTREPPFNANSHLQLVQKIRKGHVRPLPEIYSSELSNTISSCLRTNPTQRPDTAMLIGSPYIWLARKQNEMVSINKALKLKEEAAHRMTIQAEERLTALESDRAAMKSEIDSQLRREWEVKARLEIDRQVESELKSLRQKFETEVQERVNAIMAKHVCSTEVLIAPEVTHQILAPSHNHHSSVNTAGESEWASTTDITDLSDLSIHSPVAPVTRPFPIKKTKTPFARSKTTFDSPADVQMSEPSPMSISGLALSPRRNAPAPSNGQNLFAEAARQRTRWQPQLAYGEDSDDDKENALGDSDDDDFPDLPSPTRPKGSANTDPFKLPTLPVNPLPSKSRPGMLRQNTIATTNKLAVKPSLFPTVGSATATQIRAGIATATTSQIPRSAVDNEPRSKATSPTSKRRLSKIPSRNDLRSEQPGNTSPLRRAATSAAAAASTASTKLQSKLASAKTDPSVNMVAGRTRVELAQARAGGRPMSADFGRNTIGVRREKDLPPVPVWDEDELGPDMPSPFLKRDIRTLPARGWR